MLRSLLYFAILLLTPAAATPSIEGRLQFPDQSVFNQTTRLLLNHGEFTTYSKGDGSFIFHNVPTGIHVLDVYNPNFHFSQIKIQVNDDHDIKCLEYVYPGAKKQPVSHPLVLTAIASFEYFEARRGFSIFGLFRNPMVIMMVFSAGLMFLMPKMMEGLEPEERERMKRQMEMQQDPSKMLGQLFGGGDEVDAKKKIKK